MLCLEGQRENEGRARRAELGMGTGKGFHVRPSSADAASSRAMDELGAVDLPASESDAE